ncbi:LIC_13215 family putative lipoprotein [Leptospira noguchii]|uniref:LIC_13215 family putative lipoprotein n=1 Tax=Leptospira noguchii TaxID=28182 RepID=UPI0003285EA4|nr:hypothetical protein [Leptospira noguchii]EMS87385.1 putative lipoprotein [Leptospira noguchii str. Hook]
MKHNLIRIPFLLFILILIVLSCKKEHKLDPNAQVVQIPALGLGLDYEGWYFSDNQNLIDQTENATPNPEIKKALEVVGVNFFLFEYPQNSTQVQPFNTNINYTVEDLSKQPREITLDDYVSAITGFYPTAFQKYEMISPPKKSKIYGMESLLLESRFEQFIGGKNVKVHNYQRIFIVNKKAHVFTGTFLDKDSRSKGPKVLELLNKFVKL